MHEDGVLDGHDALLALDRRSQPLGHAKQAEMGQAVVEAELSCDPRRDLGVRGRRLLPAILLRVEVEAVEAAAAEAEAAEAEAAAAMQKRT